MAAGAQETKKLQELELLMDVQQVIASTDAQRKSLEDMGIDVEKGLTGNGGLMGAISPVLLLSKPHWMKRISAVLTERMNAELQRGEVAMRERERERAAERAELEEEEEEEEEEEGGEDEHEAKQRAQLMLLSVARTAACQMVVRACEGLAPRDPGRWRACPHHPPSRLPAPPHPPLRASPPHHRRTRVPFRHCRYGGYRGAQAQGKGEGIQRASPHLREAVGWVDADCQPADRARGVAMASQPSDGTRRAGAEPRCAAAGHAARCSGGHGGGGPRRGRPERKHGTEAAA